MGKKVNDFKTYKYKDMYKWGSTEQHIKSELDYTKDLIKKIKGEGTPQLDWINSKGYDIIIEEGATNKGYLDNLGMNGYDYTFYLVSSWTKESFLEYISDYITEDKEFVNFMGLIGLDIDDLPIYGRKKSDNFIFEYDGDEYDGYGYQELVQISKEDGFDISKLGYGIKESDIEHSECPLWGAKVPMRFNMFPSEGSESYRIVCEYGLSMIRHQIGKLMLSTGVKRYEDLESKMPSEPDMIYSDTEFLINYLNRSNLHVSKNEDIEDASRTGYNLYKAYKLFYENHTERRFRIPKSLVSEFLLI